MRLNRLDLIRYGRFKDAEIGFPRRGDGTPDVTVIYGANEAGKSTAFHGFLELLFGFKAGAHPYAFRFERSDLLVGAEIDLPGRGATVLRRNSKRSQSLLDAQDRPLNEAILSGALHGLSRDAYEERFSLNDKGLREGGERIAGAQGDLGQLLHAGISGLTGMARTLDALSDRADRFHKKRGRATVLKTGADRLKEIGRDLRADQLTMERERKLRRDCEAADAGFNAAKVALSQAHHRQAAAMAAQLWYDRTEDIQRLTEDLAAFPDGPDLPPGATERVAGLVEKIDNLQARISEAIDEIAEQDRAIADNPADAVAPLLSSELDRLDQLTIDGAPLIGRATTARVDLARRNADRDALTAQIEDLLARLSAADVAPAALALDQDRLEALGGAVQACLAADLAAQGAQDTLESALAQRGEAPAEPRDLGALRTAFDAWQDLADLAAQESAQKQASERLIRATAELPEGWRALIDTGLPARETLEEIARERSDLNADLTSARNDLDARAAELAEAQADLSAQEAAPDTVDSATTEETRRRRDMAWQAHRGDLSNQTAEGFEAAMYADDGARAHFLTGAEARQRLRTAQANLRSAMARHDLAKTRHDTLGEVRERLAERGAALARALGLPDDTPAAGFGARHQALSLAAGAKADLDIAQQALVDRETCRTAALDALRDAARAVGLDPAQTDLPGQVRTALTLEDSDRKAWARWQESEKAIETLDVKARQSKADRREAQRHLDGLTAALPLPDRSLEGVRTALPHLRSLQQAHGEHRKLSARIEALEQADRALTESALRLAHILDTPEDEARADPLAIISLSRRRVLEAARADEKREAATTRKAKLHADQGRAETDLKAAQHDLAGCFKGQGGEDLAPRERVRHLAERDRLRGDRATADRARQKARADVDGELFAEELALLPDAARASELEQAAADAQLGRDAARDLQREAARLYREAFDAADRSDLATEQATLLEDLRSGARQAMVARLGVLAARGALRRLASERRSSMLRDVEAAFVTMTAPAWSGVDVWSEAEGEKLIGVQPNGVTVPVEQMSTGTMGQLYFALRLAGYRSFARDAGPLPMILDDIMETFDDTRARAALKLCAEIGSSGQAILFTHHAHLVDLARESIDGVAIVDMPD